MRLIDADAEIARLMDEREVAQPGEKEEIDAIIYAITNAPTIESRRPDWIPCEDGLPEKVDYRLWSKNVLATVEQKTGERYVIEAYFHYGHEKWKHDQYEDFYVGEVIAWQPIPEPYNPDHIRDTTKKVDQFREPTKMMQEERQ